MANLVIGREIEQNTLKSVLSSNTSEFIAIYGRRRVGKTFLIRNFFAGKKSLFFDITGTKKGGLKEQIRHFTVQVSKIFYKGVRLEVGKNWDESFELLTNAIESVEGNQKIVLFFDEFPWMVTKNSRLLQNLDYYWNQHWSKNGRIKLIICGSSASWIIEKIVNNKGGLHNRLTRNIHLAPFTLSETKKYLQSRAIHLNNKQIAELFMVMGGIPYYLNKLEKGLSATQLIENLAFKRKSFLLDEAENLFSSLFEESDIYIQILRKIAAHRYGIGQERLLKKMGKALQGKGGLEKLKALQDTDFIISFKPHLHKVKGVYYKVIDEYSLFYFYWIEPIKNTLLKRSLVEGYWTKLKVSSAWYTWAGLAFESICYEHLAKISQRLSLDSTAIPNSWRYVPKRGSQEQGAQIDLLFDRNDDSITICEIKYSDKPFVIDKAYSEKLKQKIEMFKKVTRTRKQIFVAMIASNGVKENQYSRELVSAIVTLDDLL